MAPVTRIRLLMMVDMSRRVESNIFLGTWLKERNEGRRESPSSLFDPLVIPDRAFADADRNEENLVLLG